MHNLTILRKRYIPLEEVDISLDRVLIYDARLLVTKWLPIRPREDFAWGVSYVNFEEPYKISRFYDHKDGFLYWYCDIIQTERWVDAATEKQFCRLTDLLVDVVMYPDGRIEVRDEEELDEALAAGLITSEQKDLALQAKETLVQRMQDGTFPPKDFYYWEYERGHVDLHTHSTYSDGTLTPRELVQLAAEKGLVAVALTDHDCIDGIPEAMAAGKEFGIEVIPGVEFSVGSIHLLAYFPNGGLEQLADVFELYLQNRRTRAMKMVSVLTSLGMPMTYDEVVEEAGGERFLGRVHFARVMLKKGYVSSIKQAFHDWIADGKPGYVRKEGLSLKALIGKINACGGVPVLAHPCQLAMSWGKKERFVERLVGYGLKGIETYYSEHGKADVRNALQWARKWNLAVTGGSDFHGANKPDIALGKGRGNLTVPYECVGDLKRTVSGHD